MGNWMISESCVGTVASGSAASPFQDLTSPLPHTSVYRFPGQTSPRRRESGRGSQEQEQEQTAKAVFLSGARQMWAICNGPEIHDLSHIAERIACCDRWSMQRFVDSS